MLSILEFVKRAAHDHDVIGTSKLIVVETFVLAAVNRNEEPWEAKQPAPPSPGRDLRRCAPVAC